MVKTNMGIHLKNKAKIKMLLLSFFKDVSLLKSSISIGVDNKTQKPYGNEIFIKETHFWDFLSGPVVKTPLSQCRGTGFNP